MATYDINSLTVRNGKLYAGGVEVGPRDIIGRFADVQNNPIMGSAVDEQGNNVAGFSSQFQNGLPAWAAIQNLDKMIPAAPQNPGDGSWGFMNSGAPVDPYAGLRSGDLKAVGDYYKSQVDPVIEFANTGKNRDYLYGAYGSGATSGYLPPVDDQNMPMMGLGPTNEISSGMFVRHAPIPDLSKWTGEEYNSTGEWVAPVSVQSSQDAQTILKKFYPNLTQDQIDKAAYAAYQKGDKYYNGSVTPQQNDQEPYYYGFGPLPVVTAVAKELGMTPQLQGFLDTNWSTFGNHYAQLREQAKGAASAEQKAHITDAIKGISMVVGGAFSFASLLNGGLGATLGMDSFASNLGAPGISSSAASAAMGGGIDAAGWGANGLSWDKVLEQAGTSAIKGAIQGGVNSAVTGQDPLSGALSGAVRGGLTGGASSVASGVAGDLGASSAIANLAGTAASSATGGLINAATQPDTPTSPGNSQGTSTQQTPAATRPAPGNNGLDWGDGFAAILNTGNGNAYGRPEWGERLTNGRAA